MRYLIVPLIAMNLGACTAMMVGGADSGVYQPGRDQRSAGVATSDSAITTKIKSKFAADSVVSVFDIGVKTWRGTVTLSGTVGSYVARDQAESIAKDTGGVAAVNNHILVEDRSAR